MATLRDRLARAGFPVPSSWRQVAVYLLVFTAFGVLHFGYKYLDVLARERSGRGLEIFVEEMTGAYTGALLFPVVVAVTRRFRLDRGRVWRAIAAHFAVATANSAALTTLRWASRSAVFPLVGLGPYDYGVMPIRYAMEYPNDVVWYSLMATFVLMFDRYREARDREVRNAQLASRLAEAQLQALRLQLQPHFLFNTLNTISSMVYEDPRATDEMIARLGELLRATLGASGAQEVPLDEELRYLDLYLEIMRARFDERLAVTVEVDPQARPALVPHLFLQPLVENAIRHGAGPGGATSVDVRASREGGDLVLEVRDHGPGIAGDPAEAIGRGIGLTNTVERLERLYGDDHDFAMRNAEGGGCLVTVRVPLRAAGE